MEFIKLSCVMVTVCLCVWTLPVSAQGAAAGVTNAGVGQTATLTAPVTVNVLTSAWYRGTAVYSPQLICTCFASSPGQVNGPQFTGREICQSDGSLVIRDLLTNYTGNYTVTVTPNGAAPAHATRQLRVYDTISNVIISSNVTSGRLWENEGSVNLTCSALGTDPIFSWTFNGNALPQDPRYHLSPDGSSLVISPVTRGDTGPFVCSGSNPVNTQSSQPFLLTISYPISSVTISSNVTSGHLWENEGSVNLTCSALGTDPIFSWTFNGSALPQDPRYHLSLDRSSLAINPVTRRDAGYFVCSASNPANNQSSPPFLLTISYPISSVTISSNVTSGRLWENEGSVNLTCLALGTDTSFSWTFNGSALPQDPRYHLSPDRSSLVISPVTRGDTGPFVCSASNPANTQSSQPLLLSISLRPSGGIQCGAQSINDSHVELSCSWPEGSPPAQVRLYLPPSIEEGADIEVKCNVPRSDITPTMTLTCRGAQEGYTDNCSLTLGLPQDPGFKDNTTSPVTAGEPVVLVVNLVSRSSSRVSSPGVLPATFTWFNGTSTIASSERVEITSNASFSQMRIANAMESDSGDYVCRAENLMGVTSFSFRVHVSPAPVPPTTTGGLSAGAIAGIVVGVLAVVVIVGVTVYCVLKKKKDKVPRSEDSPNTGRPKEDGSHYSTVLENVGEKAQPYYVNVDTRAAEHRYETLIRETAEHRYETLFPKTAASDYSNINVKKTPRV